MLNTPSACMCFPHYHSLDEQHHNHFAVMVCSVACEALPCCISPDVQQHSQMLPIVRNTSIRACVPVRYVTTSSPDQDSRTAVWGT